MPSRTAALAALSSLPLLAAGYGLAVSSSHAAPNPKSKPSTAVKVKKVAQAPVKNAEAPVKTAPAPPALGVDLAPDPFTPSVNVVMKNPGKGPVTSRIVLTNPDNFLGAGQAAKTITVPAGGQIQTKFPLPGAAMAPDTRYSFTAEVEAGASSLTHSRLLNFFRIERAWKAPAMDGTMDNWTNASMIVVSYPGRYPGMTGWKGRADLTATARFLWDTNYLWAMVRRTDDVQQSASSPEDKNGDRVRVMISPTGSHLKDATWVSVDVVATPDGPVAVRESHPSLKLKPGPIAGAQLAVAQQGNVNVYLAGIPWKELGIGKGVKTKRMGLTVRAIDDDGEGAKSWLEWGNGADLPPDPTAFADVSLGD